MRLSTPAALLSLLPLAALCGAGATYLALGHAGADTPRRSSERRVAEGSTQSATLDARVEDLLRATGARAVSIDFDAPSPGSPGTEGRVDIRLTYPPGSRDTVDAAAVSALIGRMADIPPGSLTIEDGARGRVPARSAAPSGE